jgi:long-subunit fatty acid transport protein
MVTSPSYETGEIAFCDFTQLKGVEVTIADQVFPHLLFHYSLDWSGWSYTQVVQGGESFVALSEVSGDSENWSGALHH